MGRAVNGNDINRALASQMAVPLAELQAWCAVWSMRQMKQQWESRLRQLLQEMEGADDGFPERPYEFGPEVSGDGEDCFFLTVASHHPGEFRFSVNADKSLSRVEFNTGAGSVVLDGDALALLTQVWHWLKLTEDVSIPPS